MSQMVTKKNGVHPDNGSMPRTLTYTPQVDILELPDELVIHLDLPGVKPEHVEVDFERGELTVKARRESQAHNGRGLVEEFTSGEFSREFLISQDIAADKIRADMKNGVLTVHLPKATAAMPRRISVKGD